MRNALAVLALLSCGGGDTSAPQKKDAAVAIDAAAIELPPKQLGLPDLASYQWRKRGGHPAFRIARTAEARNRWADVVTTCKQALAADPGHLEAAWLLAAGLGKLGKLDEVIGPLQIAAAGDFGKWGQASLELPELAEFLKTPTGDAWKKRVETDRIAYSAALVRTQIVASLGDFYGFDPDNTRWYRLTRTFGGVVGALRVTPTKLAYIARQRGKDGKATLAIGVIDLTRGKTSKPIELAGLQPMRGPVTVAFSTDRTNGGIWVGANGQWRRFDDTNYTLIPLPKATRPPGPWLEINKRSARLHSPPVGINADWDGKGLASAIRIARSGRVISVPAPGLIDGDTITWSPDRSRIAFVAQLDDQCAPNAVNAAAFVADTTTGAVTEIVRAESLAVDWMGDRKLVVDKGGGVMIHDLDGSPAPLTGADGLLQPRRRPTCTPQLPDDVPQDPDSADSGGTGVESAGSGVVEPPPSR